MQTAPEQHLSLRERRVHRLVAIAPYLLLFASTALALLTGDGAWGQHLETLGLAALAAVLMWTVTGLRPEWISRPGVMAAYVACLVVLLALLSAHSVWFAGFFAFTCYIHSWWFLRGVWRYAGVTASASVAVSAYMGGPPEPTPSSILLHLLFVAVVVALVSVFSHLGQITAERSAERERMVERLRESIRENEGLHAQLLLQAREAGIHDERQRMAREIHDTLAQGLAGIIAQLQAAERARDDDASGWRGRVANATRLARENLADARRSVHALGPAHLEAAPLDEALSEVTSEWASLHAVRAGFTVTGTARPLHAEVEAVLLRTAQEALANVAKHAGASRVGVTLSYMEDVVTLDVRDDGTGFGGSEGANGAGVVGGGVVAGWRRLRADVDAAACGPCGGHPGDRVRTRRRDRGQRVRPRPCERGPR